MGLAAVQHRDQRQHGEHERERDREPCPSQPAVRPGIQRWPSAITTVPRSGHSTTSQAKVVTSAATGLSVELRELVDVDRQAAAVDRDDQTRARPSPRRPRPPSRSARTPARPRRPTSVRTRPARGWRRSASAPGTAGSISGLRRASTPPAPMQKISAETTRYQPIATAYQPPVWVGSGSVLLAGPLAAWLQQLVVRGRADAAALGHRPREVRLGQADPSAAPPRRPRAHAGGAPARPRRSRRSAAGSTPPRTGTGTWSGAACRCARGVPKPGR